MPNSFGRQSDLNPREMHLIEVIGDFENSCVTALAELMEVTKGAISQALGKLDKKGYTQRKVDPKNLSRTIVSLTPLGRRAYQEHKAWHEQMGDGFSKYIENQKPEDIATIFHFMDGIESILQEMIQHIKQSQES